MNVKRDKHKRMDSGAFVAFILASYTLVQAMMDSAARGAETLVEIHAAMSASQRRVDLSLGVWAPAA